MANALGLQVAEATGAIRAVAELGGRGGDKALADADLRPDPRVGLIADRCPRTELAQAPSAAVVHAAGAQVVAGVEGPALGAKAHLDLPCVGWQPCGQGGCAALDDGFGLVGGAGAAFAAANLAPIPWRQGIGTDGLGVLPALVL